MTSVLNLYYDCLVEKDKNFILDNNGTNAIETYLATLDVVEVKDFQYVKQGLSTSIKVNMSQTSLCMGKDCDDLNYAKITNGEMNPCYYFIVAKRWKSTSTLELDLLMDTLNTFQYDSDYVVSPKSLIKRQHKNRFTKIPRQSYSLEVEVTSIGQIIRRRFTSFEMRLAGASSITYTTDKTLENVVVADAVINGIHYIDFRAIATDTGDYTIVISYNINALLNVIDLKSEEISAPTYKVKEHILYEKSGSSQVDWCLYYRTADEHQGTPIDCYLIPENPVNIKYQGTSGEITNLLIPDGHTAVFFDYNMEGIYNIDVDGTIYSSSIQNIGGNFKFTAIAISNVSGTLKVRYGTFIHNTDGNTNIGEWTLVTANASSIEVINAPETMLYYDESSLPATANAFYALIQSAPEDVMTFTALVNGIVNGKNSIDKTLSTNIKIINLPYSPTNFDYINGFYEFAECWRYDNASQDMKLIDFNTRFNNEVVTDENNILYGYLTPYTINLTNNNNRTLLDPKLHHSDYYRPKFVYDSFNRIFALETIDYANSQHDYKLIFDFVMTRNIVSKFLFKFKQFKYVWGKEDFEDIIAVSRNNEEVLYNSQYLDYIRTGYNYDLKAKERTETAGMVGIGLNVASLMASIGIGALTGNPIAIGSAVVSGIGLASQLVNYAKSTAQSEENLQRKLQETKMQGVSVLNADDYDLLYSYSGNKAKYVIYEVSDRMKKVLDDLFFYCGYLVNEQGKPATNTRRSFNFVQASLVINHTTNLENNIQEDIIQKFEDGVIFLHYSFNKFDFDQDKENIERSLL